MIRTTTLKSVVDGVLRLHGLDPRTVDDSDTLRTATERVSDRVETAWEMWPWTELTITEERAFRPVWNATDQFRIFGENGKPDEVFYIGNVSANYAGQGYYKVKSNAPGDPPPGTLPTNTTYFQSLTPVDTFIALDQRCRRRIGRIIGIHRTNPRLNGACCQPPVSFRPSEKGIDVLNAPGPTVFVEYILPPSKFTYEHYIEGQTYTRGQIRFFGATGECYIVIAETTILVPTDNNAWRLVPLPEMFAIYAKQGAFADSIDEIGDAAADEQIKLGKAAKAEAKATRSIQSKIDLLLAQGQKHYWMKPVYWSGYGWCVSQPWTGSVVTTLSDVCEPDGYFPSPITIGINWEFRPEITALLGPSLSVQALPTTFKPVGSVIEIIIGPLGNRQRQTWQLLSGPADPGDGGQIAPLDYNVTTNDKHWEKVG